MVRDRSEGAAARRADARRGRRREGGDLPAAARGGEGAGLAILVSSSETPELLLLCDRILVIVAGASPRFDRDEADEARIAHSREAISDGDDRGGRGSAAAADARPRGGRLVGDERFAAVLVLLLALFVFFSLTQERFFTPANIKALLTSASILWVVSIGLTFVMLAGGFDLSVGSMLALSGSIPSARSTSRRCRRGSRS